MGKEQIQDTDSGLRVAPLSVKPFKVGRSLLCESPGVCERRGRVLSKTGDAAVEFLEAKSLLVHSCDGGGGGADRNC